LSHAHAAPKAERPGVAAVLSISVSITSWSAGSGKRVPVARWGARRHRCIYLHMCIHTYNYTHTHTHTHKHTHTHTHTQTHTHTHTTRTHTHTHTFIHLYICIYIYIHSDDTALFLRTVIRPLGLCRAMRGTSRASCAALCCAALRCAVLCCAALRCAALRCAVPAVIPSPIRPVSAIRNESSLVSSRTFLIPARSLGKHGGRPDVAAQTWQR
jgi:hypothetical protein